MEGKYRRGIDRENPSEICLDGLHQEGRERANRIGVI